MGNVVAGVVLAIVGAILLLFALAWATGAPSAPTAQISGTINPTQSQTFQVTFSTLVESTAAPNSIWQLPTSFVYSITESNANGGTSVIAQQQHVGASVAPGHCSFACAFNMTATISVTTVAVCASCSGTTSNITITVTALSWGGALASPTSTIVFSSNPAYTHIPPVGPVNSGSYLQQSVGLGVLGAGLILLAVAQARPHPNIVTGGIILSVVGGLVAVFL